MKRFVVNKKFAEKNRVIIPLPTNGYGRRSLVKDFFLNF